VQTIASLLVFLGLSALFVGFTAGPHGATQSQSVEVHEESESAEHGSDAGHDHEHDHDASDARLSLAELRQTECEHEVSIIDCDECRYEAGVAKIDPQLADGLVETQPVSLQRRATHRLELTGEVRPDLTRVIEVASAGSGRVERIQRFLGETAAPAETLAVIQSAQFAQAQAGFLEARARGDLAAQTYAREKRLFEQKIGSQADFLVARSEMKAAQAALAAARKDLQLFGLSDEQIETLAQEEPDGQLGQLVLQASIAGTVVEQNVVRGQLVNPGEALYRIADLSRLWVWCDVYESDLASLHERVTTGEAVQATVRVKAFPQASFPATVDLLGPQLDRETRTLKVRLVAENRRGRLKPGMFARVFIDLDGQETVVTVPETAVLSDAGENFVFARLDDDLWIRRDVTLGRIVNGAAEVVSGLVESDVVATKGAFMFKSEVLKEKMGAGCAH